MAVMRSKDGKDLLVDCSCGCDNGVRIKVQPWDEESYAFITYTNGNFYRDQEDSGWRVFCKKWKKIWAIMRGKDFYYADICMSKADFQEFKDYLSSIE